MSVQAHRFSAALAAMLLVFICQPARSQNITGTVLGTVTDSSGAVVPGAAVSVTNTATLQFIAIKTDNLGNFLVPYLKPASYTVRVWANGFKTVVRDNVLVQVDDQVRVDFALEIGEVTTTISVHEQVAMIDTEKGSLGQVVSERVVSELPLQGRNVFDLVGLTAGVQTNPLGEGRVISSGSATGLAIFNASDISTNGGRYRTNEFLLDGVSIVLPVQNQYALSPTPDGTQEFKVMSNSYGPQFGRSGGGVVNVVTKGGTNEFHGTAYELFRNDRLVANNFFANARGQERGIFRFHMFGGTLGGPVIRNRTFVFADYQGHREWTAFGGSALTLPTEAQRQGDFSNLLNAQGQPVIIYDPLTTRANPSGSGYLRTPFSGNRISPSRFDPVAAKMQQYVPLPNRPGEGPARLNNWVYAPDEVTHSDQFSIRLDHRFSDRHSLDGRYTRNTGYSTNSGEFDTPAATQPPRGSSSPTTPSTPC